MDNPKKEPKKRSRIIIGIGIFAAIIFVVVVSVFFHVSGSPEYCGSCHIMEPHYDSWKDSAHNEIGCINCHYGKDVPGYFSMKFHAIGHVIKYTTGAYEGRLWPNIEDSSCLREGCHNDRLLAGEVDFAEGITFDHAAHLGELRRGKQLSCTSCHTAGIGGRHISVDSSVCFTCHFTKDDEGKDLSDCTMCHAVPEGIIERSGLIFDHSDYTDSHQEDNCRKCHTGVTVGDGAIKADACNVCHTDEETDFDRIEELHKVHVTEHKAKCYDCHGVIAHGSHEMSPVLTPDANCVSCHAEGFTPQIEVYAGTGGVHAKNAASPMFAAGIGCAGCHQGETGDDGETYKHLKMSGTDYCVDCHNDLYAGMLLDWQKDTRANYSRAETMLSNARSKINPHLGSLTGEQADELLKGAEGNLNLVLDDASWGAHNVIYTNRLIHTAVKDADKAVKLLNSDFGYDASSFEHIAGDKASCAKSCHFGIEHKPLSVEGQPFVHGKHVIGEQLACKECHDEKKHGVVLKSTYNCASCHHVSSDVDCTTCHSDFRSKAISYKGKTYKHAPHLDKAKLDCARCHPKDNPTAVSIGCVSCHHEDKEKDCAICHGTQANMRSGSGGRGVETTPSVMPGLECRSCHTNLEEKPGPSTCTRCHAEAYGNILGSWQTSIDKKLGEVAGLLSEVKKDKSKLSGITVDGKGAETLYNNARVNYNLVKADSTRGAHNQAYASSLLNKSKADLEAILDALE